MTTKSLRLSDEKEERFEILKEYTNSNKSDSDILRIIFDIGVEELLTRKAIYLYQQTSGKRSLKAIADEMELPLSRLYTRCAEMNIKVMDISEEQFEEELQSISEMHNPDSAGNQPVPSES